VKPDRPIPNNKTDIISRGNEKGTCLLIDAAISGDRNMIKKEAKKILNYKDLVIYCYIKYTITCKICDISQIQYTCILFCVLNLIYLKPEDGQCDRNM
jgi:hypothetical protein